MALNNAVGCCTGEPLNAVVSQDVWLCACLAASSQAQTINPTVVVSVLGPVSWSCAGWCSRRQAQKPQCSTSVRREAGQPLMQVVPCDWGAAQEAL